MFTYGCLNKRVMVVEAAEDDREFPATYILCNGQDPAKFVREKMEKLEKDIGKTIAYSLSKKKFKKALTEW